MTKTERFERLRQLPCCNPDCVSSSLRSQVCHANWSEFGKGMGLKANDKYTIPLCATCHKGLDQYGKSRAESKEWFLERLEFVNEVLYDEEKTPIF